MSSEIFSGSKTINIPIYYTTKKNKAGVLNIEILEDEKAHEMLSDAARKSDVKTINATFSIESWQDANQIYAQSLAYDHQTGRDRFLPHVYRDLRLKSCLIDWDIKDDAGESVPCDAKHIGNMHWKLASALLDKYEASMLPDKEEDEKN